MSRQERDDCVLEKLITFEAESADLEEGVDHKPDADDEQDGPPLIAESSIFPLCPSHAIGPFPSTSASLSPFGCRPSSTASTMSGARQVRGRMRQT
jgi:hypothetical protein